MPMSGKQARFWVMSIRFIGILLYDHDHRSRPSFTDFEICWHVEKSGNWISECFSRLLSTPKTGAALRSLMCTVWNRSAVVVWCLSFDLRYLEALRLAIWCHSSSSIVGVGTVVRWILAAVSDAAVVAVTSRISGDGPRIRWYTSTFVPQIGSRPPPVLCGCKAHMRPGNEYSQPHTKTKNFWYFL